MDSQGNATSLASQVAAAVATMPWHERFRINMSDGQLFEIDLQTMPEATWDALPPLSRLGFAVARRSGLVRAIRVQC